MEESPDARGREKFTRREALRGLGKSAVTAAIVSGIVGGGALVIKRMVEGDNDDLNFGSQKVEDESYASRIYFDYDGGKLKQLYKTWRAIGEEIKSRPPTKNIMERDKLSAEIKSLTSPVDTKKAELLARFDQTLIPELLVEFIQNKKEWPRGTPQEMLIRVYRDAGGNVESVAENGTEGITPGVVDRIYSKMEFLIELTGWLNDHEFGKTTWSKLTFFNTK